MKQRTCDARTRSGGRCKKSAGWGTEHVGQGRCRLHGGSTPIKNGLYSTIKNERIRELMEEMKDAPWKGLEEDVRLCRALIRDFVERYEEYMEALVAWHESFHTGESAPKPKKVLDISAAVPLVEKMSKVIERAHKMETEGSISLTLFAYLMEQMGVIVAKHVTDPDALAAIERDWGELRADPRAKPSSGFFEAGETVH
ncbi:MAG TPA: hypothetical protein VLV83_23580 [Acidobacteriota bacterium]|nr:hypothetical protein [Acidobacteriota bacterium]